MLRSAHRTAGVPGGSSMRGGGQGIGVWLHCDRSQPPQRSVRGDDATGVCSPGTGAGVVSAAALLSHRGRQQNRERVAENRLPGAESPTR